MHELILTSGMGTESAVKWVFLFIYEFAFLNKCLFLQNSSPASHVSEKDELYGTTWAFLFN